LMELDEQGPEKTPLLYEEKAEEASMGTETGWTFNNFTRLSSPLAVKAPVMENTGLHPFLQVPSRPVYG